MAKANNKTSELPRQTTGELTPENAPTVPNDPTYQELLDDALAKPMPCDVPPTVGVVARFAAAALDLDRVEKTGRNKGQGYDYITHEDIVAVVRRSFFKQQLVLTMEVLERSTTPIKSASGTAGYRTELAVVYKVLSPEGEALQFIVHGEGMDYGDKSFRKAMTCCMKTWLLQALMISSSDDKSDADAADVEPVAQLATQQQRQQIIEVCGSLAAAQKKCAKYWSTMTSDQANRILYQLLKQTESRDASAANTTENGGTNNE